MTVHLTFYSKSEARWSLQKRAHHLCQDLPLWESTRTLSPEEGEAEHPPTHQVCTPILCHLGAGVIVSSYPRDMEAWRVQKVTLSHTASGCQSCLELTYTLLGSPCPRPLVTTPHLPSSLSQNLLILQNASEVFHISPHPRPGHSLLSGQTWAHRRCPQPPAASVKSSPTPPSRRAALSC